MTTRSKKGRPPTDEELDTELERLFKQVEAADKLPLTPKDQPWFESLPEAPPLPSKEGDTMVVFFKSAPARPPAAPRKKSTRVDPAPRPRHVAKGGRRQR